MPPRTSIWAPKGETGDKGPTGDQGPIGDQGPPGIPGAPDAGFPNLLYWVTGVVDGVTSNQVQLQQAITARQGLDLYWPDKTFVRTGNLAGFHNVNHWGPGVLKIGAASWNISGNSGINTCYVSTTGLDTNDGLDTANARGTIQGGLNLFKAPYMPNMLAGNGQFRLKFLGGNWTEGGSFAGDLQAKNYVLIEGTLDSGGLPLAKIDGTTSLLTAGIYLDGGPSRVYCRDIESSNFRANSVASGFVFANKGLVQVFTDNLHSKNNLWAGINVDSIGQINMKGGTHDANTNYNLRVRGGVAVSIGRPDARITFKNSVGAAVQIRDCCSGHFDYVDFINHPSVATGIGLWATNESRVTLNDVTLTNANLGALSGPGSSITFTNVSFTNVPTQFRCEGNGVQGEDSDPALIGGQGWSYDSFFDRYTLGANVAPVAAFSATAFAQFTKKTTTADWAHLVPASTIARLVFGNPTSNTFFRRDYDYANSRITEVINGAVKLRINAADINPGVDLTSSNGILAARWTDTFTNRVRLGTSSVIVTSGAGSPEGVLTAPVGSAYTRTDGGAITTLYVKESGTGNTGWVAK